MDDVWLCVEDDDSYHSASDSDMIDSETEAELYSAIHYEENLKSQTLENVNVLTSEFFAEKTSSAVLFKPTCGTFSSEKIREVTSLPTNTPEIISNVCNNYFERDQTSLDRSDFLSNELNHSLNSAKKHEPHSVNFFQNNNSYFDSSKYQVFKDFFNQKSPKNEEAHTSHVMSQKNNTILLLDSSGSDDDILREVDSSVHSDFKTNLLKDGDMMHLDSSDSSDESPIMSPYIKRESVLQNLSMPNIKLGERREGLWHINNEDLYRQRKYSHRYHEALDIKCSNCFKKGHTFRTCPVPKLIKCFICGGSHIGSKCKNRLCSTCHNYGHYSKQCQLGRNSLFCKMCNANGHVRENCPDLWRRYHLTTAYTKIIKGGQLQQDTNLYCWNCGDCGHFGSVCKYRYTKNLNTWPCVVSYDDPEELLRKRLVLDEPQFRRGYLGHDEHFKERIGVVVRRRRDASWNQRNKPKAADDFGERGENEIRRRRPRKKMDMRFNKVHEIIRENDFPRNPKREENIFKPEFPESMRQILMKKKKFKKQKFKKQNRKKQNRKQYVF